MSNPVDAIIKCSIPKCCLHVTLSKRDVEGDYDGCVVLIGLTLFAVKGAISNSCLFEVKLEEISLNVFLLLS